MERGVTNIRKWGPTASLPHPHSEDPWDLATVLLGVPQPPSVATLLLVASSLCTKEQEPDGWVSPLLVGWVGAWPACSYLCPAVVQCLLVQRMTEPLSITLCSFLRAEGTEKGCLHVMLPPGDLGLSRVGLPLGVAALLEPNFNLWLHCKVGKTSFTLERISNVDTCVIVYFCFSSFPLCSVSII